MDEAREASGGFSNGMSFEALVMLFGPAGLVHLGAAPDPTSGQERVGLQRAKQTIELLDLLKEKTTGNLTTAEAEILDGVLFDLRCRYVDAVKGS